MVGAAFANLSDKLEIARSEFAQFLNIQPKLPDVVFHYTDAAGLLGILEKTNLWLTHFRFFSDSSEIVYVKEVVKKGAAALRDKVASTPLSDALFTEVMRWQDTPWDELPLFSFDAYLCCFSETGDLLSQWRAYGSDGEGFSLGLDPSKAKDWSTKFPVVPDGSLRLLKVDYSEESQLKLVNAALSSVFLPLIEIGTQESDSTTLELLARQAAMTFHEFVLQLSLFMKNPGFVEEREWRVVCAFRPEDGSPPQIRFRATPRGLVPYVEVECEDKASPGFLPLRKVVVGPAHSPAAACRSIELLLGSRGYDPGVIKTSRTSYRGRRR